VKIAGLFQGLGIGQTPAARPAAPGSAEVSAPRVQGHDAAQLGLSAPARYLRTPDGTKIGLPERGRFTVGRSKDAEVRLDGDLISRSHCQGEFRNGQLWLLDTSSNGTFVNGKALPENKWFEVPANAHLGFGQPVHSLQLGFDPAALALAPSPGNLGERDLQGANGQVFRWPDGVDTVRVGRSDKSHMQLADHVVSNNHAMLRHKEGKLLVLDTQSRNGTYLNGEQIPAMHWTEVPAGAALGFGDPELSWKTAG
jgi:pSer/pThr/pTyr-binding forkhead associated (FHA) protein